MFKDNIILCTLAWVIVQKLAACPNNRLHTIIHIVGAYKLTFFSIIGTLADETSALIRARGPNRAPAPLTHHLLRTAGHVHQYLHLQNHILF